MAGLGFALDLGRRRGAGPARAPLDGFAGQLYAAFGLRRLLATHAGPGLRVRRSSDGAEADIGFTGDGALDVAVLLAFANGASAYGVRWYDQSGHGRHATQSTAAAQPRLVNAGELDVGPNGRAAMVFDGSNDNLLVSDALNFPQNVDQLTMAAVANVTNGAMLPFVLSSAQSSGSNLRAGIGVSGAAARVSGRRLTTDAFTTIAGAAGSGTGWRSYVGRIDYAGATADMSSDGTTAAGAFLPPGAASQDLATALAPCIGGLYSAQMMAGGLAALALAQTALPIAALDAALAEMKP